MLVDWIGTKGVHIRWFTTVATQSPAKVSLQITVMLHLQIILQQILRNFMFLNSTVGTMWLGLGTEVTWPWLGKDHVLV